MELMNCNHVDAVSGLAQNFIQLLELENCHLDLFTVKANTCHAINSGSIQRKGGDGDAAVEGNI